MRRATLVILGLLLGCDRRPTVDTAPPVQPPGTLSSSPARLDFGGLELGEAANQTLVLSNPGEGALTLYDVAFSDDSQRIHWSLQGELGGQLAAGAARSLEVGFHPLVVGRVDVELRIHSDDPDNPLQEVALVGEGLGTPDLSVEPSSVDFGQVDIGDSSEASIALSNFGTANLEIFEVTLSDDASGGFTLEVDPSSSILAPGAENGLVMGGFTPIYDGAVYGSLVISSSDPDTPELTISLTGEGDAPGLR